jgi:hypothetical protein
MNPPVFLWRKILARYFASIFMMSFAETQTIRALQLSEAVWSALSCPKIKAARRRLFNSNPMIVDQAVINAGLDFRR